MKNNSTITAEEQSAHMEFIHKHWPSLAAEAYEGYQERGRGILVIDDEAGSRTGVTPCFFAAGSDPKFPGYPSIETESMVREYNPKTEVVFVVHRRDGGQSSYRLAAHGGHPTPAAAAQRKQRLTTIPSV